VRLCLAFVLAAGAPSTGCGRLGYEAIEPDASRSAPVDAAAPGDAAVDGAVPPVPDADLTVPDAAPAPDAAVCTGPTDCGAARACVAGQCVTAQRLFISAASSSAAFGGLAGADALCQGYADAAQLGGQWRAWLSSSTVHAQNRLVQSASPYRRLDGALVADGWQALTSGTLVSPIDVDEHLGGQPGAEVWTGTTAMGLKTTSTCSDWQNGSNMGTVATVGFSSATDATWSSIYLQFCDRGNVHLYCIEQ
jgi:hypothetical protein